MAEFTVHRGSPVVSHFEGYGAQLNQNVFAKITTDTGVTQQNLAALPGHVEALAPQFVRIFFSGDAFPDTPTGSDGTLMKSFLDTIRLAQAKASSINVTFWQIGPRRYKDRMPQFADLLNDLLVNQGITKLKWVTIRNEPNEPRAIPKDLYLDLYDQLDKRLKALQVRSRIRLMGGDLTEQANSVEQNQRTWFRFLAQELVPRRLVDDYSIHVYWNYDQPKKIQARLDGVHTIWTGLPDASKKPLYVTEYGVRGFYKKNNVVVHQEPGVLGEGSTTRVVDSKINAFQHAWFNLVAARLGFHGLAKWDAYYGKYDTGTQEYGLIGKPTPQGWVLRPAFELTRLFTHTVKATWDVVEVDAPEGDTRLVVAFEKPGAHLTVIGLDRRGGSSEAPQPSLVRYRIDGLPRGTTFQRVYWNRQGGGKTMVFEPVRSDATGTLEVEAPLQSVFAVTTLAHPLG